jgi:hypothetical protein
LECGEHRRLGIFVLTAGGVPQKRMPKRAGALALAIRPVSKRLANNFVFVALAIVEPGADSLRNSVPSSEFD